MSAATLVLNSAFNAVDVLDWETAVSLVYQGHAQAVDENLQAYDFEDWVQLSSMMAESGKKFVHTSTMKIAVPEVIRLTRWGGMPKEHVNFNRKNIYRHYDYTCCYCNHKFKSDELNLDHVIPKSRGGKTSWDNIVLSCIKCNTKKDNKTPQEAGMTMHFQPSRPTRGGQRALVLKAPVPMPVSWQRLIDKAYWEGELKDE